MVAYQLVIVGAHSGLQSAELVAQRAAEGPVLLVEPIPYLFEGLAALHAGNDSVQLLNAAITEGDVGHVDFYAPRQESGSVLRPGRIVFEFKHSDGVFTIGCRFAGLLVLLEDNGYRTSVLDVENCMATRLD